MERLTMRNSDGSVSQPTRTSVEAVFYRLADYEDIGLTPEEIMGLCSMDRRAKMADLLRLEEYQEIGSIDHFRKLAQAEKDGRLVVLEPAPAAKEGAKKPTCFYNDMGQEFCLGFGRGREDDEPIDKCKECWYCEFSLVREEAEAALKKREGADNEAD